nr:cupin domain-containing protein [Sphingomonas populi]
MKSADRPVNPRRSPSRFKKISGNGDVCSVRAVHHGEGAIDVHRFAFFAERKTPYFVMFDMPPGSSEGIHAHRAEIMAEAWLDEYYYVITGNGIMRIDGEVVEITQGDFIYTPAGVFHGIENTAETGNLKVMVTLISVPPA